MPTLYTVIRRPLITEKGMTVKETQNTLVFEVALKATKTEVKQAVENALQGQRLLVFAPRPLRARNAAVVSSPATARLEEGVRSSEGRREDARVPQQPLSRPI